jgi:tetratricopeptide (TPR) repeat protein
MNPFSAMKLAARLAAWVAPKVQTWAKESGANREEGERHLSVGNYTEAERYLLLAVAEAGARKSGGKQHTQLLLNLATGQWKQHKLFQAKTTAQAARETLGKGGGRPGPELATCLDLLGNIALDEGDAAEACRFFEAALEVEEKLRPARVEAMTVLCRRLADVHRRSEDFDAAETFLKRAIRLSEDGLGQEHRVTGDRLSELGVFYQGRGRHAESQECFERALAIHQRTRGRGSEEAEARDFEGLAEVFQQSGDAEKAEEYYKRAFSVRERQVGGDPARLAVLMMKLAGLSVQASSFAQATELLLQAVGRFEAVRDERRANALVSLAEIYHRFGRDSEAAANLMKACSIWDDSPADHTAAVHSARETLDRILENLSPEDRDAAYAQASGLRGGYASPVQNLQKALAAEVAVFRELAAGESALKVRPPGGAGPIR